MSKNIYKISWHRLVIKLEMRAEWTKIKQSVSRVVSVDL